jgi:DNA-binding transcriptional LysR family regulator
MNVTIRQLRALLAVAQEGTIANASEKLFLTRPAVSQTLQELERQFGRKLFHRVSNRLILNSEGKQLLPYIDELLQRVDQIENFFSDNFETYKNIKIGTTQTIGNYLLPGILHQFHLEYGAGYPSFYISSTADLCAKLQTTDLDIVIVESEVQDPTLKKMPWIYDEMIVISAPEQALGRDGALTIADLDGQSWVAREQGSGSREQFDFYLGHKLKHQRIALEVNATEAVITSVSYGIGLAFVSKIAAAQALSKRQVVELPLQNRFFRDFCIATYSDKYIGTDLQALLDFLVAYRDKQPQR